MIGLDAIKDLSPDELGQFRRVGIRTIEDLLTRIKALGAATVASRVGLEAGSLDPLLPECRVDRLPAHSVPVRTGEPAPQRRRAVVTLDALWDAMSGSGPDMVEEETGIRKERLEELVASRERREKDHRGHLKTQSIAALKGISAPVAARMATLGVASVGGVWDLIEEDGSTAVAHSTGITTERLREVLKDTGVEMVRARLPDVSVPIEHFEDITAAEAQRLRAAGIATVEEVRACLAESGLDRIARESGVDRRHLLSLFSRQAVLEGTRLTSHQSHALGCRRSSRCVLWPYCS